MVQLIKIHPVTFRVKNIVYEYVKPKYLMPENEFRLIEAKVKGSTMVWNVEGERVSYNQIRTEVEKSKCLL